MIDTSTITMATSTHVDTFTDMYSNNLSILIIFSDIKKLQYDTEPHLNGSSFLSKFNLYANDDNAFQHISNNDAGPFEDNITDTYIFFEI